MTFTFLMSVYSRYDHVTKTCNISVLNGSGWLFPPRQKLKFQSYDYQESKTLNSGDFETSFRHAIRKQTIVLRIILFTFL